MSYILDALRKADQQRQRGTAPTLATAQAVAPATKRTGVSLNLLLGGVLIGAGILIGWLRPWQTQSPVPAAPPHATVPLSPSLHTAEALPSPAAPKPAARPVREPAPAPVSTAGSPASGEEAGPATAAPHAPAGLQVPPGARIITPSGAETAPPTQPVGGALTDAGQDQKPVEPSALPPSVRQGMPPISISFQVYTKNPEGRRVIINGQMLSEGDLIAPGLRLEQITPDGVIVGYRGYHIRRGVH